MKVEVPEYLIETIWKALRARQYDNEHQIKAAVNPAVKELFRQEGDRLFDAEKIFYEYHIHRLEDYQDD